MDDDRDALIRASYQGGEPMPVPLAAAAREAELKARARRTHDAFEAGIDQAVATDRSHDEAKRQFELEKLQFRAALEKKRRESDRLQQVAHQKRLEAQEARRKAEAFKQLVEEHKRVPLSLSPPWTMQCLMLMIV